MSNYDKVVKSATKPKIAAPKAKYVDVLVTASFSQDASLNDIIRSLASRLREPNTIVVFKSLVVLHTLIRHGAVDPVLSHLVSNATLLRLKHIASIDSSSGYTPPRSLSVYAYYLDCRVRAYRELRRDVIRAADPRADGGGSSTTIAGGQRLRRLKVEKGLLREISLTQKVMNAVLSCSFFLDDPSDEITLAAFRMALKDLLDLYAAVNEGVINMLEHYFEMSKVDASTSLKVYRDFCNQTEKVVAYLTAARKYSHALRVAIPQLKHAPIGLAGALDEYLSDPNFEQNRVEYRKNRQIADGEPASSSSTKASGKEATKEEGKKEEGKEEAKKVEKPPIPSNNQALQDFFASIDTDQHTMAFQQPIFAQQQLLLQQQQQAMFTGMGGPFGQQMGMQPTGMMLAPQMTGFNPFLQPNMTGMMAPQQQQNAFLQAQLTGMDAFGGGQRPQSSLMVPGSMNGGFQQPQLTGAANPFRPQSVFVPSSAASAGMAADLTGFGILNGLGNANAFGNAFGGGAGAVGAAGSVNGAGGLSRLQPISESGPSTPTGAAGGSAPPPAVAAPSSSAANTSSSLAPAKPLLPQKTGSRNPFAPPPGSTPPPQPEPAKKPGGPSLFELAAGVAFPQQQQQQQGSGSAAPAAQPSLVPQKTGLIGDVASEFAFGRKGAVSPAAKSESSGVTATADSVASTAAGGGGAGLNRPASSLSTGFSGLSLGAGGSSGTSATSSVSGSLAPQPTGFGGSAIKPFQPSSSFGQTLSAQVTGFPPSGLAAFGGSAAGSGGGAGGGSALAPNMTGNPFARSLSPGASAGAGAGATGGFGQSLFGSSGPGAGAGAGGGGAGTAPAAANGNALNSASGLGQQFTSLAGTASPGGLPGAATNLFGSSLFRSGTITGNPAASTNPFPSLAAQPTGAFLSGFTSGLSSTATGLQPQPTGLGGSAIKPFQPTSAFGTAALGGITATNANGTDASKQQQQQSLF
ncbi:hypothetical protein V8E36_006646 [Tilletia maclaganii]